MILAIDPGNIESGYICLGSGSFPPKILDFDKIRNDQLIHLVKNLSKDGVTELAIEIPACYGMAVGQSVFDTCIWAGRFMEAFIWKSHRVYRKKTSEEGCPGECMSICKNNRAKDSNIRQALIDLYPATGGGKTPQIGTKKEPGPLYGISKDVWAALAVGITYIKWKDGIE